jgi:hypothetical protein
MKYPSNEKGETALLAPTLKFNAGRISPKPYSWPENIARIAAAP